MSLLDDVSIVVTPNGYKEGELYAVVPVPVEGADVIDDGNFPDGSTAWDLNGWTISGNAANCSGITANLIQTISGSTKKQFLITFTISNYVSGSVIPAFVGGNPYSKVYNANGTFTEVISSYSDTRFVFYATSFDGSISNVSVKEYTAADMDVTRATAATRVDEAGLVNYAEIIGSEEVTDGNFPSGTTAWIFIGGSELTTDGARINNTVTGINSYAQQILTGNLSGKQFVLTYDVILTNGKTLALEQASSLALNTSTTGTNRKLYFTWTRVNDNLVIKRLTTGTDVTIDNVSLKEVTRNNVPRIDYSGGGCPHILAEPMRTNLIPYSEKISEYTKARTTVIDNNTTSPNGTVNASKVTKNGENANDRVRVDNLAISNTTDCSLSAFIKNDDVVNGGVSTIAVRITGGTLFRQGYEWNGSTLSITTSQGNGTRTNVLLEDYGNGWWKVGFSFTSDGTEADIEFDIDRVNGTDTTAIFLWGTQLEVGSYGTSYIPNFGTAAGVTRNQDIFTRDGIGSLINSTEGVLFLEASALSDDNSDNYISITNGSTSNLIAINLNSSGVVTARYTRAGVTRTFSSTVIITNNNKVAIKWRVNDFALWVNGVETDIDLTLLTLSPNTLNTLDFTRAAGQEFFGKVKQLQVYKTALTDEQLVQLTGESGTDFYESYAEMASALTYTIQ